MNMGAHRLSQTAWKQFFMLENIYVGQYYLQRTLRKKKSHFMNAILEIFRAQQNIRREVRQQ